MKESLLKEDPRERMCANLDCENRVGEGTFWEMVFSVEEVASQKMQRPVRLRLCGPCRSVIKDDFDEMVNDA